MKIKEAFRMLVRAGLAIVALVYSGMYAWRITFATPETVNDDYAKLILGFLLGTLVSQIINFYLGGNDNAEPQNPGSIPEPNLGPLNHIVSAHGNEAHLGNVAAGKSGVDDEHL